MGSGRLRLRCRRCRTLCSVFVVVVGYGMLCVGDAVLGYVAGGVGYELQTREMMPDPGLSMVRYLPILPGSRARGHTPADLPLSQLLSEATNLRTYLPSSSALLIPATHLIVAAGTAYHALGGCGNKQWYGLLIGASFPNGVRKVTFARS